MRRSLFAVFFVFSMFSLGLQAQRDSIRNEFINAESWFMYEEYGEAEFIYQKLLKLYPDNNNLKYRIGICLLKDPYRKQESIQYLLEASKDINPEYKEGSFKETTAPPDVLYYLGAAYQVNEKLDEAISSFESFLEIMDAKLYDEEMVRAQIQTCQNAKRLMSMPVDIDLYPVSQGVNTRYPETHPVVSGNGERMAYVTEQPFFDEALFIEKMEDSTWTLPMSLTSMLGFDEDIYPVSMNFDGSEMLLYYDDDLVGNLYSSTYEDGFWTPAKALNICTKYWESHASFSKDGKSLYFTSNRKGTLGGLDIWVSQRQADGSWGEPENLGEPVNTRYNEETPYITEDGKALYFSSYGHYNMGGYDIFYARKKEDGTWSEPVNLGYPINTTDDDLHFLPVRNGFGGYMSRLEEDTRGRLDLYYIDIYSANNPRTYIVTGFVRTQDEGRDLTTLEMSVIDPETGETLEYRIPIDSDGTFHLNLTQGDYELRISGEGYEPLVKPLNITPKSNKDGIALGGLALVLASEAPRVFEGDESGITVAGMKKDSVIEAEAGQVLLIPLSLENGKNLTVTHKQGSELISQNSYSADRKRLEVEITPLLGENAIALEMIDQDGDIHRRKLTVIGTEHILTPREQRKLEREMRKAGIPPSMAGTPVALLLLDLRKEAESKEMQDFLDELDLEEENISTVPELFARLYEEAEAGNLDMREVDLLLAEELSGGDVKKLKEVLMVFSAGPLKDYMVQLDLEAEGISTVAQLMDHLSSVGPAEGFSMDDVRKAMLLALEPSDAEILLLDLQQAAEPGALKQALLTIEPDEESIYTRSELAEYLYSEAETRGYSKEELDVLLATVLTGNDVQALADALKLYASDSLGIYLDGLDLEAEGFNTAGELMQHLKTVAGTGEAGFSMEDVRAALIMSLETDPMRELVYYLRRDSSGPLKDYLEGLDLEEAGIGTPVELFKHLYDQADSQPYTLAEVDLLLANELSGGDADKLYQLLLENSEGALKEYLEDLDLEANNITTAAELLEHLRAAAESGQYGFTMEDVRRAMLGALEHPLEVERIYNDLLQSVDPGLRNILSSINLDERGITTVEELIDALYKALLEEGYSRKEIREMLNELFPGHTVYIQGLTRGGITAGLAVGVLAGVAIIILLLFIWRRRQNDNE